MYNKVKVSGKARHTRLPWNVLDAGFAQDPLGQKSFNTEVTETLCALCRSLIGAEDTENLVLLAAYVYESLPCFPAVAVGQSG